MTEGRKASVRAMERVVACAGERVGVGFFEAGEADILNQLSHCFVALRLGNAVDL